MIIVSYFTENGIPKPGLSPVIKIVDIELDSIIVNNAAMTALAAMTHCYSYNFSTFTKKISWLPMFPYLKAHAISLLKR